MSGTALWLGWLVVLAGPPAPGPVATSPTRGLLVLNGAWQFQPAVGQAAAAPTAAWVEALVPGSWAGGPLPQLARPGQGDPWGVVPLAELGRGWYQRRFEWPAAWQGRTAELEVTRVSTDARVFCNGRECGRIGWPGGRVDLSAAVQPGADNELRLLVAATADPAQASAALAGEPAAVRQGGLDSRGLSGEVLLHSRPVGPHIADVFVQTSVQRHELGLTVALLDVATAGPLQLTAQVLGPDGKVARTFEVSRPVVAAARQELTATWPWPDPVLWELGRPYLYALQLAVRGAGVADTYPQRFGFREFRIDGLGFRLNEVPLRLRPVCLRDEWNTAAWVPAAIAGALRGYAAAGFNLGEHWPSDEDSRGSVYLRDLWAREADEQGFLLTGSALSMGPYLEGPGYRFRWDQPAGRAAYAARLAEQLAPLRNHPSIVMWGTTANTFGRGQDQNPVTIGRRGWFQDDQRTTAGREGVELIRRVDPTRPIFTHHGADVGDLHTCNHYLCLIPLQEREEWLSEYVGKGELPYLPIEFGTPLHTTFMRGRNGFGETIVSEPLMTEFCAVYLGDRAYDLETAAYRERLARTYQGGERWQNWHNAPELEQAPAFQEVQALFVRNTWRSWRTWGLAAGMVPWSMAHGWTVPPDQRWAQAPVPAPADGRGVWFPQINKPDLQYLDPAAGWVAHPAATALQENNGPLLAWIAGPPERFTAKDHLYTPGEAVRKQLALLNDSRTPQQFEAAWEVTGGRSATQQFTAQGSLVTTVGPGETKLQPLSFQAPNWPAELRLELTARVGQRTLRDTFDLQVRAVEPTAATTRLWVCDPAGDTSRALTARGYRLQPWDGTPQPGQLLVIGRHALERAQPLPGLLARHVAAGGRLLLCGQSPEWLREAMGWRVARHVSRRVFTVPTQREHPIVAGLEAADLRDWRGAGTLVPETGGGLDESPQQDPPFGWHWGNQGSVCSAALEKPHLSGWRPVLEAEFDLAYSPLLELHYGQGLALWSQLDLEARSTPEPLAARLLQRMVQYALTAPVEPRAPRTVYVGGPAGERLLRGLGLRHEVADQLPAAPALVVIGADASLDAAALRAFLDAGGRALLLPRPTPLVGQFGAPAPWIAAGTLPAWPEARGLSRSDLRLRGAVPLAPVTAGELTPGADGLLGRLARGRGVALQLQLTPDQLPVKERGYLRYSRWRLTRTLTQLLANLGGSFELDERSLTPGWHLTQQPLALAGDWQFRVETLLPAATDPTVRTADRGVDPATATWSTDAAPATGWSTLRLPGGWESLPAVGERDGAFWVRREVEVPEAWAGRELVLQLGAVDDRDVTWFNGTKLGEGSGWNVPRSYAVPGKLVRAGRNRIVIRVFDEFGGGGFFGRPEELRLGLLAAPAQPAGEEILQNPNFADQAKGWNLGVMGGAAATLTVTPEAPPELLGQRAVQIEVTKPSTTSWHVSFGQPGFGIQAGTNYLWQAWVKSSAPASLRAAIEKNHPPYGGAGLFERVTTTPQWRLVKIPFRPTESDSQVRFTFQELATQAVTFWFAAPSFVVVGDPSGQPPPAPAGLYHPDYQDGHALGDDPYRYYRW